MRRQEQQEQERDNIQDETTEKTSSNVGGQSVKVGDQLKKLLNPWIVCALLVLGIAIWFFTPSAGSNKNTFPFGYHVPGIVDVAPDKGKSVLTFKLERGVKTADVYVWDWYAEDGDIVNIAGQEILLKNAPACVPGYGKGAVVEVLGVVDGGGGITVGVAVNKSRSQIMSIAPGQTGLIYIK